MENTNINLLEILYKMYCSRIFELELNKLFESGSMHGTTHLSVGQEATAVGAVSALNEDDIITSTHRGHALSIAKGLSMDKMMAELFGRETGCCKGLGGSLHITDVEHGNYGSNGVMGANLPIAAGLALAAKRRGEKKVVACFFGDASSNCGLFQESLNMAALWKLPVIYICENNLYGMSTPVSRHSSLENIADRAPAFGIPGIICDGNDVLAVMDTVSEAAQRARNGEGPSLLELKTYRWLGHSKSDQRIYRSRVEEADWRNKCPIKRFRQYLLEHGYKRDDMDTMEKSAHTAVMDAIKFAYDSPQLSFSQAKDLVYGGKGVLNG